MNFKNLSVLVPFKGDNGHRDRVWAWVKKRYELLMPETEICIGSYEQTPFSRSAAINAAAKIASRDIFLISDADIIFDPGDLIECIKLLSYYAWVIPYSECHMLTEQRTNLLLQEDCRIEMNKTNHEIENIKNSSYGGICIVPRLYFENIGGFDEKFKDWGGEDDAFQLAMDTMCGPHHRINTRVWHLWHPVVIPDQLQYQANYNHYCSYFAAFTNKEAMKDIIDSNENKDLTKDVKPEISLCMIVKNEEDVIARCLDSVADIVDEIIIVDTGSTDKTKDIVKNYTTQIYDFEWINDFSAARNYSFSKATKDYIFWLDADDVILDEDRQKFKELKNTLNFGIDVVMMKYNVGFDIEGNVTFSYYRERLVKKSNNPKWHDPVHEHLDIFGTVINTNICISHHKINAATPGRNLNIYENMIAEGKELSPRSLCYFARELYYNANYDEAIRYFNQFLDSGKGWVEDCINACYDLSICYNHKDDQAKRLKTLLRSFEYDTPRAEICCGLGYYYIEKEDYKRAIFWFDLAAKLEKQEDTWGFKLHDCWGYLPNIQLCICHDKLGNIEQAIEYNNRAEEFKPGDPFVLSNKRYFDNLKKS